MRVASRLTKRGSTGGKPGSPDRLLCVDSQVPVCEQRPGSESRAPALRNGAWQGHRGGKQREMNSRQRKEAAGNTRARGSHSQRQGSWGSLRPLSGNGFPTYPPADTLPTWVTLCCEQGFCYICKARRDLQACSLPSPCHDPVTGHASLLTGCLPVYTQTAGPHSGPGSMQLCAWAHMASWAHLLATHQRCDLG